jgi:hypothetical protein
MMVALFIQMTGIVPMQQHFFCFLKKEAPFGLYLVDDARAASVAARVLDPAITS